MLLFPALAGAQALPYTAADYDAVSLGKAGANLTETSTIANGALTNTAAMPFSELPYEAAFGYALWQPSSTAANVINAGFAYNLKQKFAIGFGFNMGLNKPYDIIDASGAANGTFTPKDVHAALGLAYRFLPFLSVGVNVGYANSTLSADHKYGALAADVFVMAKFNGFKATAGVSNLGSKVTSANGLKFSLPASFALGAGYEKTFAKKHGVDVSLDADYYFMGAFAAAAGATYSARWTTIQIESLVTAIKDGLKNPGFSFIEVATQCPTYFGRKNKLRTPTAMAVTLKMNTVFKSAADRMRKKDLEGKIVVGEFANSQRVEFTENIERISEEKFGKKTLINSAYEEEL